MLGFLRASLKGWQYAIENPDSIQQLVRIYHPQADDSKEIAEFAASLPFINTGVDHLGWMAPDVWLGMEKTLRDQEVLSEPVNVEQIYTLQFLEEIYNK